MDYLDKPDNLGKANYISRKELLDQIRQLQFMSIELTLFLNTHPYDSAALEDHNATVTKLRRLQNLYNKRYGMLTPMSISRGDSWEWVESPWPWERSYEED